MTCERLLFGSCLVIVGLVSSLAGDRAIAQDDIFPQGNRTQPWDIDLGPAPVPASLPAPRPEPPQPVMLPEPIALDVMSLEQVARTTTIRIFSGRTAGSGAIVARDGDTYTAITNWHVVGYGEPEILTPDERRHGLIGEAVQIGNADLAVVRFRSSQSYAIAPIASSPVLEGDALFAAGFPMYGPSGTTLEDGTSGFRLTTGRVSLVLNQSLVDGYRLGYTNAIAVGMSGGPIFNAAGELVGVNGRTAGRDPSFGAYVFQDGSLPSDSLLEVMVASSWGIPVNATILNR